MKDIADIRLDLDRKRKEFNHYRISNGVFGKSDYLKLLETIATDHSSENEIKASSLSSEETSKKDQAPIKRYERTIRQGYFLKRRSR